MNDLARDFERRAKEQAEAAVTLFDASDFSVDAHKQSLFIVAKTTANLLHLLAELTAYLKTTDQNDEMSTLRQEIMEKSNAVRTAAARAAASGNWDEFDRLTGITEGGSPESDAT